MFVYKTNGSIFVSELGQGRPKARVGFTREPVIRIKRKRKKNVQTGFIVRPEWCVEYDVGAYTDAAIGGRLNNFTNAILIIIIQRNPIRRNTSFNYGRGGGCEGRGGATRNPAKIFSKGTFPIKNVHAITRSRATVSSGIRQFAHTTFYYGITVKRFRNDTNRVLVIRIPRIRTNTNVCFMAAQSVIVVPPTRRVLSADYRCVYAANGKRTRRAHPGNEL